jgi:EpsI family protein
MSKGLIDVGGAKVPVMKLVATQGQRIEPITYWVMLGDSAVRGNWEQHFARLKYGLTGKIPYGIVIRVSTISANESRSYRIQEQFVRDMLSAVPVEYRKVLMGTGL